VLLVMVGRTWCKDDNVTCRLIHSLILASLLLFGCFCHCIVSSVLIIEPYSIHKSDLNASKYSDIPSSPVAALAATPLCSNSSIHVAYGTPNNDQQQVLKEKVHQQKAAAEK
ncbi:unnamed protein product, partial [Meganyctiphanes norvegica]